jgi:hypothetical protein
MWYLLAEKTAAAMRKQIEEGMKHLTQTMFSQERAEAEHRAAYEPTQDAIGYFRRREPAPIKR